MSDPKPKRKYTRKVKIVETPIVEEPKEIDDIEELSNLEKLRLASTPRQSTNSFYYYLYYNGKVTEDLLKFIKDFQHICALNGKSMQVQIVSNDGIVNDGIKNLYATHTPLENWNAFSLGADFHIKLNEMPSITPQEMYNKIMKNEKSSLYIINDYRM